MTMMMDWLFSRKSIMIQKQLLIEINKIQDTKDATSLKVEGQMKRLKSSFQPGYIKDH
jgi:hypothetical protein